jgi:ADP-ribose pyrophosphatase
MRRRIDNEQSPYRVDARRVVWSCPWYAVRRDEIVTPDGEAGVYNVVTKQNAVWIVPLTANGEIVLIYNYRYTVDDWCWEVPAGGVEGGETPLATAQAELRQEVGGTAVSWQHITDFYVCNGFCDEIAHLFLARDVRLDQTPRRESTEVMEIHRFPRAEALQMARSGQISDGPSALALLLCEPHFPNALIDN